ncbi:MAG: hypothetical protein Q9160_005095 [Pyrenula sp. 1 TL-2023]
MAVPAWFTQHNPKHQEAEQWAQYFKSYNYARMQAYRECKKTDHSSALCYVCQCVDFEYMLFGAPESGFRRFRETTIFMGTVSDVEMRATAGCPFCRHILMAEADRARGLGLAPLKDLNAVEIDVLLKADDIGYAPRDKFSGQGYGRISILLGPVSSSTTTMRVPGAITQETDNVASGYVQGSVIRPTDKYTRCHRGKLLCLLDHRLSRFRSLEASPNLRLCKSWFKSCQSGHSKCKRAPHQGSSDGLNGTFKLIELSSRHIVELGEVTHIPYATLSYVCGRSDTLWKLPKKSKLWARNVNGKRVHPLPADLPKTISDALIVADALDLQYLWVDSFCITQDDPIELQQQINAMYQIYTGASICLIATTVQDSHSGIPGIDRARPVDQSCQVGIKEGLTVGLPRSSLDDVLYHYKWMNRAWTFQELVLSKCCLIFTDHETFFHCASMTCRESDHGYNEQELDWRQHSWTKYLLGNASLLQDGQSTENVEWLCLTYGAAVREYSRRELSYQSDGLNAFQGFSGLFGRVMSTQMIFGCPKNMLVNCLRWRLIEETIDLPRHSQRRMVGGSDHSNGKDGLRPLLPSWAWVAWNRNCGLELFWTHLWGSEMQIFDSPLVSSIKATPMMRDKFMTYDGDTKDSKSTLRGILPIFTKMATLRVSTSEDFPGCLVVPTSKEGDSRDAGFIHMRGEIDKWNPQRVYARCIQIWVDHDNGQPNMVDVMLIERFPLPACNRVSGEEYLKRALKDSHALKTAEPLTAQRMMSKDGMSISGNCPPGVRIEPSIYSLDDELELLLASSIGVGRIIFETWTAAKPKDAIILLG